MPIKSIVVHLADDPRHLPRLRLAADMANRFDAHLNVVYAKERVDMPAGIVGRGASMAFIAVAEETEREHAAATRKEVEDVCAGLRSWEWHEAQGEVDKVMAKWAHLSDLVIAEQSPQTHLEDKIIPHMADHLVMLAGAPMLLVPVEWEWAGDSVGKQILVAWKNSREANGAVRSALPFLKQADKVVVLAHTYPGSHRRSSRQRRRQVSWLSRSRSGDYRHQRRWRQPDPPGRGGAGLRPHHHGGVREDHAPGRFYRVRHHGCRDAEHQDPRTDAPL